MLLTGYGKPYHNFAFFLPCVFWLLATFMRVINSKSIVLFKGVNMTKGDRKQVKKNCNFLNLIEIARSLALLLSPLYLGLCWYKRDLIETTHIGAFTIFLVWLNVTFTMGKYPTFGIYITIVNYVGWEVLKLVLLYLTTLLGTCWIFKAGYLGANIFIYILQCIFHRFCNDILHAFTNGSSI